MTLPTSDSSSLLAAALRLPLPRADAARAGSGCNDDVQLRRHATLAHLRLDGPRRSAQVVALFQKLQSDFKFFLLKSRLPRTFLVFSSSLRAAAFLAFLRFGPESSLSSSLASDDDEDSCTSLIIDRLKSGTVKSKQHSRRTCSWRRRRSRQMPLELIEINLGRSLTVRGKPQKSRESTHPYLAHLHSRNRRRRDCRHPRRRRPSPARPCPSPCPPRLRHDYPKHNQRSKQPK